MKKIALALLIAFALNTHAGNLSAQINTDTLVEGDSFQLIISTDGQGSEPDLSPLQKDFTLLGRSQSSNISIINGNVSKKLQWIVTLSPKRQGALTIPAITAGGEKTKALKIKVIDASKAPKAQGASNGIKLTTRINASDKLYVFQEIPLTVRIETSQPLLQAGIVEPQLEGAELRQSGQDRQSQITQKGHVINIIERDYILRVQRAGEMRLKPFTLKGEVLDNSHPRDPFSDFDDFFGGRSAFGGLVSRRGKPFSVRGNSLTLNIEGKTTANTGEWFLPAKAVELQAKWQTPNPTFKAGEPVTRIISLLALGAQPEQLPTLQIPKIDGIHTYIDMDKTDKIQTAEGAAARRIVIVSVLAEYGGNFTLPAMQINWQNTVTGKPETATLAAEIIKVSGAPAPVVSKPSIQKTTTTPAVNEQSTKTQKKQGQHKASWLLGSGAVVTLVIFAIVLMRRQPFKPINTLQKAIKIAITNQDAKALYRGLLAWKKVAETNTSYHNLMKQVESAVFAEAELNFGQVNDEMGKVLSTRPKKTSRKTGLPELYQA